MARTVDLWEYLPPFLKDFREMRELLAAELPEFQGLSNTSDGLINEVFILTATETGIGKFESMMGIVPALGESLESRRSAVLTRWYDSTPYTVRALRNRIIAIQGNDRVDVGMDTETAYKLNITTRLEMRGQVDDLGYIIQSMIPCNLIINSKNWLECEKTVGIGYSVGMTQTETLMLTDDLNERVDLGVPGYFGIGNSTANIIQIN